MASSPPSESAGASLPCPTQRDLFGRLVRPSMHTFLLPRASISFITCSNLFRIPCYPLTIMASFAKLPLELVDAVATHLDAPALAALSRTCRDFHATAIANRHIFKSDAGGAPSKLVNALANATIYMYSIP